jgi:adenylate cyclase
LLAKEATKWEVTALRYLASFIGILAVYIIVDQDYKFLPDHNYLLQVIRMAMPFGFLFIAGIWFFIVTEKNYIIWLLIGLIGLHGLDFSRNLPDLAYNFYGKEEVLLQLSGVGKWTDYIFPFVPMKLVCGLLFLRFWPVFLHVLLTICPLVFYLFLQITHPSTFFSNDWELLQIDSNAINSWFLRENITGLVFLVLAVFAIFIYFRTVLKATQKAERSNVVLGRYFSPDVKNEIEMTGGSLDQQKPKDLDVAILFTDIVGFTKMSEKMDPKDVLALLSEYQAIMVGSIFKHNGTVDKFIGDAVMANFGTPKSAGNDAKNAFDCALTMNAKLKEWNKSRIDKGLPVIEHRIGIHYGACVVGNIGSELRTEFAVIGDPVNVASRICDSCKEFDTNFIISKDVADRIGLTGNWDDIKNYKIRGRKQGIDLVKIYS